MAYIDGQRTLEVLEREEGAEALVQWTLPVEQQLLELGERRRVVASGL